MFLDAHSMSIESEAALKSISKFPEFLHLIFSV
jgi:hypothetical protein